MTKAFDKLLVSAFRKRQELSAPQGSSACISERLDGCGRHTFVSVSYSVVEQVLPNKNQLDWPSCSPS
jgi:hypothetical protein